MIFLLQSFAFWLTYWGGRTVGFIKGAQAADSLQFAYKQEPCVMFRYKLHTVLCNRCTMHQFLSLSNSQQKWQHNLFISPWIEGWNIFHAHTKLLLKAFCGSFMTMCVWSNTLVNFHWGAFLSFCPTQSYFTFNTSPKGLLLQQPIVPLWPISPFN